MALSASFLVYPRAARAAMASSFSPVTAAAKSAYNFWQEPIVADLPAAMIEVAESQEYPALPCKGTEHPAGERALPPKGRSPAWGAGCLGRWDNISRTATYRLCGALSLVKGLCRRLWFCTSIFGTGGAAGSWPWPVRNPGRLSTALYRHERFHQEGSWRFFRPF